MLLHVPVIAQNAPFPPDYALLPTDGAKAIFLVHAINDSSDAGRNDNIVGWAHAAIALAHRSHADSLLPQLYQAIADVYSSIQPDSAPVYYRYAYYHFSHPSVHKKIYLLQSLVYAYANIYKADSELYYLRRLHELVRPMPDSNKLKLSSLNTIASGYADVNLNDSAIAVYRHILEYAIAANNNTERSDALINIGLMYNLIANNEQAVYYTRQAIPYVSGGSNAEAILMVNLARYYTEMGHEDSAVFYITKGRTAAFMLGDSSLGQSLDVEEATLFIRRKKYSAAGILLKNSLQQLEQKTPSVELVNCLLTYAALDTAIRRYPEADAHLRRLYQLCLQLKRPPYRLEALGFLAMVNKRMGNYRDAYAFQKAYQDLSDSIKTDHVNTALSQLQTEYQTLQQQQRIRTLESTARIRDLELQAARRNKVLLVVVIAVIICAFIVLLYNRQLRAKALLQTTRAQLETKTLRSQMNPHFIFNALNSVQKYIWENRREDAAEFLTKFARLTRMVLENSQQAGIPLAEELKALKLYIQLEHRRSNQHFDYTISIQPEVNSSMVQIPPLLLQPYVENAIWHGLSHKEERGYLSISIWQQDGLLYCLIDDDGIGRAQAAAIRARPAGHRSMAMNLSDQRIAWLQQNGCAGAGVHIKDKMAGNVPAGTAVQIILPLTASYD